MHALTSSTTSELILELGAIKEKFNSLFGILIVGLIGSRARGDNTHFSDVDVAVRRQRRIGLMTVVQAKDWLEQHLGINVDLVFFESLPDYKRAVFLQDFREVA
jgi:predicted nucleotidyltransferase